MIVYIKAASKLWAFSEPNHLYKQDDMFDGEPAEFKSSTSSQLG